MKKIIYLLGFVAVFFTSCNPMDEVYEELDKDSSNQNVIVGSTNYTLTEDDYKKELGLRYPNFGSNDEAKAKVPSLLTKKFPVWGNGSLAEVTYNLYAPKRNEKSLVVYTVTSEDYEALELRFPNFSRSSHITNFLKYKYPNPSNRQLVSLTYKYFSGGKVSTLNNGFLYLNDKWEFIQGITKDEYSAMGESYPNFSSKDEAESKITVFLKEKFKYDTKKAGDIEAIMYKLYVGGGKTNSYVAYFIYNGTSWSKYNNILTQNLQFGHDGKTWVPDNTIRYTLTNADYALVGNDRYNNFDVRTGKAEETVEARLTKINTILSNNFPNAEEGQKYVVIYNIYNGAAGVWEMKVIKKDGKYILNE